MLNYDNYNKMSDELEIGAALAAVQYIKNKHPDNRIHYSIIAISSGEAGPERIMMTLLKDEGYQLDNVWLVDVYYPKEPILNEIRTYAKNVYCVTLPEMKQILLTTPPSKFNHTYCFAINYQVMNQDLLRETKENYETVKLLIQLHQEPSTWVYTVDPFKLSYSTKKDIIKHPNEYKKIIQDYYNKFLNKFGIESNDPYYPILTQQIDEKSHAPVSFHIAANILANKYTCNEFGHFMWLWLSFDKSKSFATIWRNYKDPKNGVTKEISIENFPNKYNPNKPFPDKTFIEFYETFRPWISKPNETNTQNGGNSSYVYRGRSYKIHIGTRGGRYINVQKQKVYI